MVRTQKLAERGCYAGAWLDESVLVAGGLDKTAALWDTRTDRPVSVCRMELTSML